MTTWRKKILTGKELKKILRNKTKGELIRIILRLAYEQIEMQNTKTKISTADIEDKEDRR